MYTWRTAVVALIFCLLSALPVRAGVYNTAEPEPPVLSPSFREFRESLIKLRRILNPKVPSPLRDNYQFIVGLAPKDTAATLTPEQRLDLGACLIRLQKYEEAIKILEPALQDRQGEFNFLIRSTLATACQLTGLEDRAAGYMEDAMSLWPARWANLPEPQKQALAHAGWNEGPYEWYRKADGYYQKLLRLRLREALRQQGKQPEPPAHVDALFDDGGSPRRPVEFVGPGGKYEAGKLAAAEKAKLPQDAIEIVEQLLVWLPFDARLYWLLGELLNARGDVEAAEQIFDELVTVNEVRYRDLLEHRQVLRARVRDNPGPGVNVPLEPEDRRLPTAIDDGAGKVWAPDPWNTLFLGFGAGVLVTFLGYWQVREIVRRRQVRASSPRR